MLRRHLKWLLVGAAVLLAVTSIPALASTPTQQPINTRMNLTLHLHQCDGGPFLTWTGTVVIDGETYGWADAPLPVTQPPPQPNDNFFPFEEHWTIFTLEADEDPNTDPSLACDQDDVVMEGHNTGWANRPFTGKAAGEVTAVAEDGPFADVEPGSRMFWNGKAIGSSAVTTVEPGAQWRATLHIL